jgi:hypothetical protein
MCIVSDGYFEALRNLTHSRQAHFASSKEIKLLRLCQQFRTIEDHATRIASEAPGMDASSIGSQFQELTTWGGLIAYRPFSNDAVQGPSSTSTCILPSPRSPFPHVDGPAS